VPCIDFVKPDNLKHVYTIGDKSQGSVTTRLISIRIFNYNKFIAESSVKKVRKSADIWRSYSQEDEDCTVYAREQ